MPRKYHDPNQLSLDFAAQVDVFADAARQMLRAADTPPERERTEGLATEDELYVEIAAACKRAIRESGQSREEVLERVNRFLGRAGEGAEGGSDADRKRPISIHMFNNYLSKPAEARPNHAITHAIARVTGSMALYEMLVADLGGRTISSTEEVELQLGKIQQLTAELNRLKRKLSRDLSDRQ